MQVADLSRLSLALEVSVEQRDSQEESLVVTLKVCKHLDHPVYHASPERRSDLMFDQAILSKTLQLQLARICHDGLSILRVHVNVLSLDLSCSLTTEVSTGMHLCEVGKDHVCVDHVALADMNTSCRLECRFAQVALSLIR